MKFRFFLHYVAAILSVTICNGQAPTLVSVTPPSPGVQAMQKYGDIPVSAYTGIPNISIPLYNVKFRDISIPVSLSYHASGIKVAEEASQTGLGWVLNAAGTISRNIIGDDDFDNPAYFNGAGNSVMDFDAGQGPTHIIQNGCNLQMFNRTIPNNPTIYNYDITSFIQSAPQVDFQPDQFYYNFLNKSGKFVMSRKMQAIIQKQESIQISCTASDGSIWQIKSEDGYIYDFTLGETYLDPVIGGTHKSAWYLTKITSPLGNTATFNYTQVTNFVQSVGNYTESRDDWDLPITISAQQVVSSGYQKGSSPGKEYTSYILSSIDVTNCHVQFYYSTNRPDLSGDERLDSLSIFSKNSNGNIITTPIKTIALGYSFFNYGDVDDSYGAGNALNSQRLKLTQIQEIGYYGNKTIKNNPYVFTYFEGSVNLPSKASFARDHWGYYNGKLLKTTLIPSVQPVSTTDPIAAALGLMGTERDPDSNFVKAFTLQTIQYPTGGSTEFQYESNDFDEKNSEVNDNTYFASVPDVVYTSQTFLYDAVYKTLSGTDTLDLTQEYANTSGGVTSYGQVTINAAFRFSNVTDCNISLAPLNIMYFDLYDSTGTNLLLHSDLAGFSPCTGGNTNACYICSSGVFSVIQTMTLLPGKYIFKPYCSSSNYGALLQNIKAVYYFYQMQTSTPTYYNPGGPYFTVGGGLRVKRIIEHDNINPANDKIKKYLYHYWADKIGSGTPQEYTFGRRMSKPEYAYFVIDENDFSTLGGSRCNSLNYYAAHLTRTSDSNNPLNGSASGAVVGYDQVTELFGENGEFGQKVYKYVNLPDVTSPYSEPFTGMNLPLRPEYSSNLPNALNGSLIEETDYANQKGNVIKIKDVSNQYTTVHSNENYVYGLENRMMQVHNLGDQCSTLLTQKCDGNSLTLNYIAMPSEWQQLSSSDEKTFNQTDTINYYEVLTNYYYDNPAHLQLTRVVTNNSKGELITTTTQYPLDFTNVTATDQFTKGVANLQNVHIINSPVEKFVNKSNSDGTNSRTVGAVLKFFNATSPTPNLAYQTELASPITNFTATTTGASGVNMNGTYKSLISFDQYDAYGNILKQHKAGDFSHSYVWDYNSSLPVAEVSNAQVSDIAQTSFEADGTGNWTIPSSIRDSITAAITGIRSYNLSNGAISKSGLNSSVTYIVSYWSMSGTYSVTGSTGVVTGKTISGWTYYEHTVTGISSVSISGSGNIDELRLYPKTAQMKSYTYVPMIGMTSNCDVDNRITYYSYDALGRLMFIKDQDGNIIKTMQYQYTGQTLAY